MRRPICVLLALLAALTMAVDVPAATKLALHLGGLMRLITRLTAVTIMRYAVFCAVALLWMCSHETAEGVTKLGTFYTQEELNCWKQRAGVSAPGSLTPNCDVRYNTAGDDKANSPGDWARIVAKKNAFMADPDGERLNWSFSGCLDANEVSSPTSNGRNIRDAAIYSLVANDATVGNAVADELLAQAGLANMDFSNTARYCPSTVNVDTHPWFMNAGWMHRLMLAYDYAGRTYMSAPERTTFEGWLTDYANYVQPNLVNRWTSLFPGRYADDYTYSGSTSLSCNPYVGGPAHSRPGKFYSNRSISTAMNNGIIGVLTGNTAFINEAKRTAQETLKFALHPEGFSVEFERGYNCDANNEENGRIYTYVQIGYIAMFADALARTGDRSIIDYSTRDGILGSEASLAEPAKSLRWASQEMVKYLNNTYNRIGLGGQRINAIEASTGNIGVHETWMATANLYWNDSLIAAAVERNGTNGVPSTYPSSLLNASFIWEGVWRSQPGSLFQAGKLNGVVDPSDLSTAGTGNTHLYGFNNVATDASGTTPSNNCTATSITYTSTAGQFREGTHAAVFNDPADNLSCPTNGFTPSQFTLRGWFRATSFAAGPQYIVGHSSSATGYVDRIQLYTDEATGLLDLGLGDTHFLAVNVADLAVNTYYWVALRVNGTSYTLNLLAHDAANANAWQVAAGTFSGIAAKGPAISLGNNGLTATQGFAGQLDFWQSDNRELTDAELIAEFNLHNTGSDIAVPGAPVTVPIDFASCEIGALADDVIVVTLTGVPNPAECLASLNANTYDGVAQAATGCSIVGAKMHVPMQSPPADNTVVVVATYTGTDPDETATCTNTVTNPAAGGGIEQGLPWPHENDRDEGTRFVGRRRSGAVLKSAAGSSFRVRFPVINTSAVDTVPAQDYAWFCTQDNPTGSDVALTRVADDFGALGLAFNPAQFTNLGQHKAVHGQLTTEQLPTTDPAHTGFVFVQGGTFRNQSASAQLAEIPPESWIEIEDALRLDPALAVDTVLACEVYAGNGTALDAAETFTVLVTYPRLWQ